MSANTECVHELWQTVALTLGEYLTGAEPDNYYSMSPNEWLAYTKPIAVAFTTPTSGNDEVEAMCKELLQYADPPDELQTYSEATAYKAAAFIRKLAAHQPVQPTEPYQAQSDAKVARYRKAIDFISTADSGGELWPVGCTETRYAEDGNTVLERVGPWHFLRGQGPTFLDAVEAEMALAAKAPVQPTEPVDEAIAETLGIIEAWGNSRVDTPTEEVRKRYEAVIERVYAIHRAHPPVQLTEPKQ